LAIPKLVTSLKKRDDLDDLIREESSRGRKRPIDTDAIRAQSERNAAVLQIFRHGTREELRALLKTWGYSKEEIEDALKAYDAALEQQSS
jgi:DNA polymerase II large subunit